MCGRMQYENMRKQQFVTNHRIKLLFFGDKFAHTVFAHTPSFLNHPLLLSHKQKTIHHNGKLS